MGFFFETFSANSSGGFEGLETFFFFEKIVFSLISFHLYVSSFSLDPLISSFIFSLLFSFILSLLSSLHTQKRNQPHE